MRLNDEGIKRKEMAIQKIVGIEYEYSLRIFDSESLRCELNFCHFIFIIIYDLLLSRIPN
jgi:hypothetical protein